MIRLGAMPQEMHEMFIDDIFLERLKLLIVMAKAFLHGYPLGRFRCSAIISNAQIILSEAIDLGNLDTPSSSHFTTMEVSDSENTFYENAKLLAEIAPGFASKEEFGIPVREKLNPVLDTLCKFITFDGGIEHRHFLEVA